MRLAFAFLLACTLVRADTLSELKQKLDSVVSTEPVTVAVAFESSRQEKNGAAPTPQALTLIATDGPDGLQLRWPRDIVAQAMEKGEGPQAGKPSGMRETMDGLKPTEVHEYLNIAGSLREVLAYAELTEERTDTWQGRPARRLALKLNPPLSKEDRKYVKELTATATLWLDDDGWPIAAERQLVVKGRALLVITFEQNEHESFEFARVGKRLIAVKHDKSSHGSGGGESGGRKTTATLRLEHS